MNLRIAFAGTPEFAALHLKKLIENNYDIVAVYTQPDRPKGRGKKLQASPVKQLALAHGIEVFQPSSMRDATVQQKFASLNLDYLVVVAYGLILPLEILNSPKYGCVNVHASLLPRWRGAAPIQRSILANDKKTGICIMKMEQGLDTGPVYISSECPIDKNETTSSLTQKLATIGATLLADNLPKLQSINPTEQNSAFASYAEKIDKAEGQLDFSLNAKPNFDKIRVFEPAWFLYGQERIRVWQAQVLEQKFDSAKSGEILAINAKGVLIKCGENTAILLEIIQLPGGKALHVKELLNGNKINWSIGSNING